MLHQLKVLGNSSALRYFGLLLGAILLSALIGLASSRLVLNNFGEQMAERPPRFMVKLLNGLAAEGVPPTSVVRIMNREIEGILPMVFYLFSAEGEALSLPTEELLTVSQLQPLLPLTQQGLTPLETALPPGDKLQGARLSDGSYLLMHTVQARYNMGRNAFIPAALSFVFFLGLGLLLAFLWVLFSLRRRASQATEVLEAIKQGDLQARFPIARMDEFGRGMQLFNQMADEIEALVTTLTRREEQTRHFFIGIAHDLRTPLASLKNMQELLYEHSAALSPARRQILLQNSLSEVHYLSELIENMLLLSRLEQHSSPPHKQRVCLQHLLLNVLQGLPDSPVQIEVQPLPEPQQAWIEGEALLLERVWRNLLSNALQYAAEKVVIRFSQQHTPQGVLLQLQVADDGPGFSTAALQSYGTARHSRSLHSQSPNGPPRISLGLGSVIIQEIVHLHGGTVSLGNQGGLLPGAWVQISLPQQGSAAQLSHPAFRYQNPSAWRDRPVTSRQWDAPASDPLNPTATGP